MEQKLICPFCEREPEQISEYKELAEANEYESAEEAVRNEEGTFNCEHNLFCCTDCYIKIGMPLNDTLFASYAGYRRVEKNGYQNT